MAESPAALFALLFPADCRICGEPLRTASRIPVCATCLKAPRPLDADYFCSICRTPFLNRYPLDEEGRCAMCRAGAYGFDAAYCYGAYEDTLRELIHLLKYSGVRTLAGPLGGLLAGALPRGERFDTIVPMPLHWRRQWRRGFNQAEALAREVGRRTGLPVSRAVARKRPTTVQAGLSSKDRRANVRGAFEIRRRNRVEGRSVLLIDDVMTTGATASACAAALKRAGARRVALLALARVDRRIVSIFEPGREREPSAPRAGGTP